MDVELELSDLLLKHQTATTEMLWEKLNTAYRHLNDLTSLATDSNNNGIIVKYLGNIGKTEPDVRQFVSVKHTDIDLVLRRFMLESALLRLTIDVDFDMLANLSIEYTIKAIKAIENCFAKIHRCRPKTHVFLHIKDKKDCIHIWADTARGCVFEERVSLKK